MKSKLVLLSRLFRQITPITSDNVETFHFLCRHELSVDLLHAQRGVFLLFQQQHGLENTIDVDFKQTIQFVHFRFDLEPIKSNSE